MISVTEKLFFSIYSLIWKAAIPFLKFNKRLLSGYEQRILKIPPPKAEIWIQAASAGETYLATELVKNLQTTHPVKILLTTNTSQGMAILEKVKTRSPSGKNISCAYFPFDDPIIMKNAVRRINPKVMVLLETEIWPGLLSALKKHGCKTLIINGRLKQKNLKKYRIWPSLWKRLAPDKILAISPKDETRYKKLFGNNIVGNMNNIKFDRFKPIYIENNDKHLFGNLIPDNSTFIVLGSIRQEEEILIEKIIKDISVKKPCAVIGLFPRHMHRIDTWKQRLTQLSLKWVLKSKATAPVSPGTILLWDTFGELQKAYSISDAVFVGGSLAPLGGQNFLEPLIYGVVPVIGPSWENFLWIGQDIIKKGLLRTGSDWREVSDLLIKNMASEKSQIKTAQSALDYVTTRQGGTRKACRLINDFLK